MRLPTSLELIKIIEIKLKDFCNPSLNIQHGKALDLIKNLSFEIKNVHYEMWLPSHEGSALAQVLVSTANRYFSKGPKLK
jgi:hypothetical protein